MMQEEKRLTRVTVQIGDKICSGETPHTDQIEVATEFFCACLIGLGYTPETVYNAMLEYSKECLNIHD